MKKFFLLAIFLLSASSVFASDKSVSKQIERLTEERSHLSDEYSRKEKDLAEITVKIHDLDRQLAELRRPR